MADNKKNKEGQPDKTNENENWIAESSRFKKLVDKAKFYVQNQEKLNEVITEAYNKATQEKGNKTVQEMWSKLQTLFRMVRSHFRKDYQGLSTAKLILGVGVLLYFILPFDLIPDWLPVAGYLDDASLLTWFIKNSTKEISKFQQWETEKLSEISPTY